MGVQCRRTGTRSPLAPTLGTWNVTLSAMCCRPDSTAKPSPTKRPPPSGISRPASNVATFAERLAAARPERPCPIGRTRARPRRTRGGQSTTRSARSGPVDAARPRVGGGRDARPERPGAGAGRRVRRQPPHGPPPRRVRRRAGDRLRLRRVETASRVRSPAVHRCVGGDHGRRARSPTPPTGACGRCRRARTSPNWSGLVLLWMIAGSPGWPLRIRSIRSWRRAR